MLVLSSELDPFLCLWSVSDTLRMGSDPIIGSGVLSWCFGVLT